MKSHKSLRECLHGVPLDLHRTLSIKSCPSSELPFFLLSSHHHLHLSTLSSSTLLLHTLTQFNLHSTSVNMMVFSTLLPLALLAAVGAAAPTRVNGGHPVEARQALIETHVPFPPGSGGGHGHHCPGLGGHQGHGVELCIHPPRDTTDTVEDIDGVTTDINTDVVTGTESDDVVDGPPHFVDPIPGFPFVGPDVPTAPGSGGVVDGFPHLGDLIPDFPPTTTDFPTAPGSGGVINASPNADHVTREEKDNDRVDPEVFVGECIQHEDCATGSACWLNWCTVVRDLPMGHDWN
ncbi:hypothetical protein BJX70DRAFT_363528 [Aspergillus crustosus]